MRILAIDPGPEHSGVVELDCATLSLLHADTLSNDDLIDILRMEQQELVVIEVMVAMGMAVAQATFDTQLWAGRFMEAAESCKSPVKTVSRRDVKMHLCGNARAKDTNVTAAAKGRFPPTGDGKDPYKGTRKQPGPLYGVSGNDTWSALAIAVTAMETLI